MNSQAQTTTVQQQPVKQAPSSGTQNKIFQLNKQIIITARKLETGPLENYIHMATLIHKINLLLLEYDNIYQLRNILKLIFTKQLMNSIIDFSMNTDNFANFGIRLLEIFSLEYAKEIVKSDIIAVVFGLLRTNDYETIVQCLNFIKALLQNSIADQTCKVSEVLQKKLIILILKTVQKSPEIEYISTLVEIVNLVIGDKEQRTLIIETVLKEEGDEKITYLRFLKVIENQQEIRSFKQLHKKIQRQIKELEVWNKSHKAQ